MLDIITFRIHAYGVHQSIVQIICGLFVSVIGIGDVLAQKNNLHCKWVQTEKETFLDTLTVDPETILLDSSYSYSFDPTTSKLKFSEEENVPDSIYICYRTFPFNIAAPYFNYSSEEYDSTAFFKPKRKLEQFSDRNREELFRTNEIQKAGTLTRGISFGNAQSANVNSSLNFQMQGKLTEKLNIRATITDQNIPFQPEGNTQQLREFDNVYIEVYNDSLSLRAGDVVLKSPSSNFLKYYKNVQGAQFNLKYKIGSVSARSSFTASSAKGQFADINIDPIEGVQGPYKLRGPGGERFIIALANSESVYLDGRILKRGYNYDYVIDYNLGELTFNPNILITQFSRIRVTFEYSDRNYSRAILNTTHQFDIGKTSVNFNFYREKDNRNRPLAFLLSNEDKTSLSNAGERNLPVPISSEVQSPFNENLLLYQRIDTSDASGQIHSVFRFSRDSTQTLYQVTFSDIGMGNGDYVLLQNTVNGRVFEWVAPENGMKQGNYEPVVFVVAPNQKQMTTIAIESQLSRYNSVYGEVAFSNHDLNLYSDIDDDDNHGMAMKVGYRDQGRSIGWLDGYSWAMNVDFEFDSENFNPIDRFRYIEFDRDWSYNPNEDTSRNSDRIINFSTKIQNDLEDSFHYRMSMRKRGNLVDGSQHNIGINKRIGPLMLLSNGYSMNNSRQHDHSEWTKAHLETFVDKYKLIPGYRLELDLNEVRTNATDSVIGTAMNFSSHQFYLRSSDSLKVRFRIENISREDRRPFEGKMQSFTSSNTTNFKLNTNAVRGNFLRMTFTYRTLDFIGPFSDTEDEETFLGRIDWNAQFAKNHIRSNLTYASTNSRELRREFVFLPVNNGEGTHTWRDLNEDGIQDITEFFEAINPDERNYIKLIVPTDEFISAFNNILNWNLNMQMPKSWLKAGGIKSFLGKFSNLSTININKKNTDNDFQSRFNPFDLSSGDEDLIFLRTSVRNNLFFNRSNPRFGFDIDYTDSRSKQLITKGIEERKLSKFAVNTRVRINSEVSLNWRISQDDNQNISDFLDDRNYHVQSRSTIPEILWQPMPTFRITNKFEYIKKVNLLSLDTKENSTIGAYQLAIRWSKAAFNSLDISMRYSNIKFNGDENTPVAYQLLEALRPGNNYNWNLNYRQKLANGLQITIGYNGRKSPGQNLIHIGRMQVTALF